MRCRDDPLTYRPAEEQRGERGGLGILDKGHVVAPTPLPLNRGGMNLWISTGVDYQCPRQPAQIFTISHRSACRCEHDVDARTADDKPRHDLVKIGCQPTPRMRHILRG